jgi:hypothetical protein
VIHSNLRKRSAAASALITLIWLLATATSTLAVSAPIHISGTDGEGVFIRPEPDTARPAIGWMPEGASPDYVCFVWGEDINGTPIWFDVDYNGVTGYYASYYDDSSYHSNEELTAKYGVPLCGSTPASPGPAPSPGPSPSPGGPVSSPPASTPPAAATPPPGAIYFNPYPRNASTGPHTLTDPRTLDIERNLWESHCTESGENLRNPYNAAVAAAKARPITITTVAGWSAGKVGVWAYFKEALRSELQQVNYALVIDPGSLSDMDCEFAHDAGDAFKRWLHVNPKAHLVIIAGNITQRARAFGIQNAYFNSMREEPYADVTSRVLVCNYPLDHEPSWEAAQYWIQHQIGSSTSSCPQLSYGGKPVSATAGWHP